MAPFASLTSFHTIPSYLLSSFVYYVDKCIKKGKEATRVWPLTLRKDFIETDAEFFLELILPRFKPEDIHIELYETTSGVFEIDVSGTLHSKSFSQRWTLPNNADPNTLSANLEYGVLRLTTNKKKNPKLVSHRIVIQTDGFSKPHAEDDALQSN